MKKTNQKYQPSKIEPKWQKFWETKKLYEAEDYSKKPKKYILIEFPYPSGEGLHVGHVRSYAALDAVARKKRLEDKNVLFPIGWDAFGLPTENYALKTGVHPEKATAKNVANFKKQLQSLGLSFDWSREINTTDPEYYQWTQWIFLKLFEKGLAYQAEIPINWCPSCKIGLANEEVVGGACERCGTPAAKKTLKQWMLKITKYAGRLIDDLAKVDFPERVKAQQKNWIGRSKGTEIIFQIPNTKYQIQVFTTRTDTLFGTTAVVLAPEHTLAEKLITPKYQKEAKNYIEKALAKSDFERENLAKEKTGVFCGSYAINPANGEKLPIWIADYVLCDYGTGAIMCVPAHDQRDFEFAKKFNLPIKQVISPDGKEEKNLKAAFVANGVLINSEEFSGHYSEEAKKQITSWLEKRGLAKSQIHYKLRDWVFSRQHYWGEPIPIIHCPKCGAVPVPEKDLPIKLPYLEKYQPTGTGESPLAQATDWLNTKCPKCGGSAKRETDTMPNWAGSNWYFLRYLNPKNNKVLADSAKIKYWMPVDWYNGGYEHTTLHLLYSRFIYKFLFDIGVVPDTEPYARRTSHGIILAQDGRKMSKSFGNVINPDEIVKEFGADTLRLYEMFLGPFDQAITWSTDGVKGVCRFLEKTWKLVLETETKAVKTNPKISSALQKLNLKIDQDLEKTKFNTIVAAFMEFVNLVNENKQQITKKDLEKFLILLSPFAPHLAEELWSRFGHKNSIFEESWPVAGKKLIKTDQLTIIIQINGKLRDKLEVAADATEKDVVELAQNSDKIKKWLSGHKIQKTIFVPNKLINFVI